MAAERGSAKKAGIGYAVGNYLLKGLSFLTVPLFSRLLSPAEYGVFNSYLAWQGILFLLVGMALHTSIKNARYKFADDFDAYNSSCVLLCVLSLAAWLLACNAAYPLYARAAGFSRVVANLLVIDSFGTALIQYYNAYIGLDYRYTSFLKLSACSALMNLGISVLLILTAFRDDRATGRILGNAIPAALIGAWIVAFFWKKKRPAISAAYARFALSYSIPLIPHGLSQVVLSQFDRIMILYMIGEEEAGIYSFAYTVFSIVNVTATSLNNAWGPWFYERLEAGDGESVRRASSQYAFGMLLFSALVMLAAPEIVRILGQSAYAPARDCVVPIVAGGYFMFLYTFPSGVEYYHEKTGYIAAGTAAAAAANVLLNALCIPRFGYRAAAYTTLLTYILYFLVHYLIAARVQGECLFDTPKMAACSLLCLAAAAAALLLAPHMIARYAVIAAVGAGAVFWEEREIGLLGRLRERLLEGRRGKER